MTPTLRELLERERFGFLATLSVRREGWPFGSITPYALSEKREPLLLLSDLAEHTRNVRSDPRASLLVQESASDDPQEGMRVTLLGTMELVDGDRIETTRSAFLGRHPRSVKYFEMADFRFYVLRVAEARFISGFGDMGWLSADRFQAALTS